jgi:hypothetical protein
MKELDDQQLKAKIIEWANRIKGWEIEWQTGIYPGEMAAFLGLCDLCGVRSIVESGRGEHAYSSQILGEYSEQKDVEVVSIDLNPIEGKGFHERLERYRKIRYVVGNAFDVLPRAVQGLNAPIALLLDGPKLQPANRLSLVATMMFDIRVVAHHNCPLSSAWGKEFSRVFPNSFHYEDTGLFTCSEWQEFKQWEAKWVRHYEVFDEAHGVPGRSLKGSSLAMAYIPAILRSRRRLFELQGGFPWDRPVWLWAKWHISNLWLSFFDSQPREKFHA